MGKLIYVAITSLDGYVADAQGNFDWSAPDEEVHAFVNDLQRSIGTYLFGRRMYEVLAVWETLPLEGEPSVVQDFATLWRAADKVVYSTTLEVPSTPRTRIEHDFDPDAVRRLLKSASDVSVAGPHLAAVAMRAGLVDEFHQFVSPVIVGGGNAWLPPDVHVDLDLIDERRFTSGVVYLRYRRHG
ncbi:MAG: dihydrofolate reductase [Glaciihabitans sp.]|nr:dihydrofolate reductase [Glaciihabitans sp.]